MLTYFLMPVLPAHPRRQKTPRRKFIFLYFGVLGVLAVCFPPIFRKLRVARVRMTEVAERIPLAVRRPTLSIIAARDRQRRPAPVYAPPLAMTNEPTDPIAHARALLEERRRTEPTDATAAALATVDASGRPSARMVLLKGIDARGFVFFTNHGSRKAHDLAAKPVAALCLHWPRAAEQVRVEGRVERVSDAESDAYFASRPRGSQIGAWASRQSATLPSRDALLERVREIEARFEGRDVPRPEFWGGYRVVPDRIEFWHGQESRLHDRVVYARDEGGDGWRVERLYP
jgi:pyridoxamine 5'-phosphate oxidase